MKRKIKNYCFFTDEDYCTSAYYENGYDTLDGENITYYTFYDKLFEEELCDGYENEPIDEREYHLNEVNGEFCDATNDLKEIDFAGKFRPYEVADCRVNKHGKAYFLNNDVASFYLDFYRQFIEGDAEQYIYASINYVVNVLIVDKKDIDEIDTEVLKAYMED